jgi:hypothetical protein
MSTGPHLAEGESGLKCAERSWGTQKNAVNAEEEYPSAANHRLGTRFEGRPSTLSGHYSAQLMKSSFCNTEVSKIHN